jgi:hypothetical protein
MGIIWRSEQRPECFAIRYVATMLATPGFHQPTPGSGPTQRCKTIYWQMSFQIVQGVADDLEAVAV